MFFLSVPTTKRQCNDSTASQPVWFCHRWAAAEPRGHLHSGPCDLRMTCCRLNPLGPELGTDSQTVAPGLPCPPLISSPGFPPLGVSPTNWAATRLPPWHLRPVKIEMQKSERPKEVIDASPLPLPPPSPPPPLPPETGGERDDMARRSSCACKTIT